MVRNDHKLILVAIAMCIIVPIVVYLGLQAYLSKEFFSTVLYADGTLIIEESSLDKEENEEKHGAIMKEYPSFEEDGYIFDRDQHKPYWYKDAQLITSIEVGSEIQPENLAFWFSDLYYVNTINVSKIDASQVESMANLFNETGYYADELTIKGIDSWDTSNVTDMQYMFRAAGANAKKFELEGGLDDWDTSKVRITVYMFCDAGKQADECDIGDLSNWDTSSVIAATAMFANFSENDHSNDHFRELQQKFVNAAIQNATDEGIN